MAALGLARSLQQGFVLGCGGGLHYARPIRRRGLIRSALSAEIHP